MSDAERSRTEAQRRADRIGAFQEELAAAIRDGAVDLTPDQLSGLAQYHDTVLGELARQFDVDVTAGQKRASLGMRVATLVGATALGASLLLYLARTWGHLAMPVQAGLLLAAPLVTLGALDVVARRRALRFATGLVALVAFAAFLGNIEMLGQIFALAPTPEALLAYGVFATALAYGYDQRLLLVAGALCLVAWLAARIVDLTGAWWMAALERPEAWLPGAVLLATWSQLPHRVRDAFPMHLRALAVAVACLAVLALGRSGRLSWIPAEPAVIETTYQVMLFVVAATAIGVGLTRQWTETVMLGSLFFVVALFTKFVDWWWASMPRYLFFLIVGLASLAMLWLFGRVRARLRRA